MINTFKNTKKSLKGFTLIELLVVIAIIGLLSTIIAAPIQNARKKAKDAKKIAEVKAVQLALDQYADGNKGEYPWSLDILAPQYIPILPLFSSSTLSSVRDAFGYSVYAGKALGSASTTFGYHLGSKLETYGAALETDRDCAGASIGGALKLGDCVVFNGYIAASTTVGSGSYPLNGSGIHSTSSPDIGVGTLPSIGSVTVAGTDFWGEWESATSTCVGNSDCVFDVTSQQ